MRQINSLTPDQSALLDSVADEYMHYVLGGDDSFDDNALTAGDQAPTYLFLTAALQRLVRDPKLTQVHRAGVACIDLSLENEHPRRR